MINAEAIDGVNDAEIEMVEVPEWPGGKVWIRTFTLEQHGAMMAGLRDDKDDDHAHLLLVVAMTLCDEAGTLLYDWKDPASLHRLGQRRVHTLEGVYARSSKLNALTESKEDIVGKSQAGQTNGSATG